MRFKNKMFAVFTLLFVGMFATLASASQVTSNTATIPINYNVAESISVSVSGGPLALPSSGWSNQVTINGTYSLNPANHTGGGGISDGFYFSSSTALSGAGNVPTSNIEVSLNGSVVAGVCNQTGAIAGAGQSNICALATPVTQNQLNATPIGTFTRNVWASFVGAAPTMPGSYSGTLNYVAWCP